MNLPQVHLLLNHFPIIGTIIATGLLVFALLGRSEDLRRSSFVILTGIALIAIPTYMSGAGAALALKEKPGISLQALAAHNGMAIVALAFMELAGMFAWLALWQSRRFAHPRAWTTGAVVLLSVITIYFMALTGNSGGDIRHVEIRAQQQATPPAIDAAAASKFITGEKWVWPTCETLHFIGLSLLIGIVFLLDLRVLGAMKNVSFPALHRLLPWATLGFTLNVMTGMIFFVGSPEQYANSAVFQWKMIFVLVAGANALYFTMFDGVWRLKAGENAPFAAKLAAASAAVLWVAIMWCGNMLPFIGDSF